MEAESQCGSVEGEYHTYLETTMKKRHSHRHLARRLTAIGAASIMVSGAQAMELDTGNPDIKARWDNTVKYSNAFRLNDRAPELASNPGTSNLNDGNNNFGKGLVSNRLDLFSEFDLQGQNYGLRLSGAAWHDTVYNRPTDNTSSTSNHTPASEFPAETKKVMGGDAELLDAFVWGRFDVADKPVTMRLGRHTLLWGETLFFGGNGIAGGQAPLDLVKLLTVPNSTFKENALPTGKLSGQMQLTDAVSLGAYVGYEWKKTRLMPVGAYLSTGDTLGPGAERTNAGPPVGTFIKVPDLDARDSGQWGLQLRWNVEDIGTDFGFYAINYHATGPSNNYNSVLFPGGNPPPRAIDYRWAYHEDIRAYGLSAAKTVGSWSLAGEASIRQNTPLASTVATVNVTTGANVGSDNKDNPAYAVGESAHLNFSWLASLGPSFISREASFVGEIAWNKRTKVTKREDRLNPNADKSATAIRLVYAPSYRQALPGLDLTPRVGLGYTWGASSAGGAGFGVNKGGDFNMGLSGTYLGRWFASLNYVHYLGPIGTAVDNNNFASFKQSLKDRNFVSFSLSTTF